MLLCKQPGDTGIYATATSSQVRLYYVLDRVYPLVSSGAAAAEVAGTLGSRFNRMRGVGRGASANAFLDTQLDFDQCVAAAPPCVPRDYLRLLRRSPAAAGDGEGDAPTRAAWSTLTAAERGLPSPSGSAHVSPAAALLLAEDTHGRRHRGPDVAVDENWGSPLTPFHTVPWANGKDLNGDGRPRRGHDNAGAIGQEWAMPISGAPKRAFMWLGNDRPELSTSHMGCSSGGWATGALPHAATTSGGFSAAVGATTTVAAISSLCAPTSLSLSCSTDGPFFFVANADGHAWIGRSDTRALSPLEMPPLARTRSRGDADAEHDLEGAGGGTAVSWSLSPPAPPNVYVDVPMNDSFSANSCAGCEPVTRLSQGAADRAVQRGAPAQARSRRGDDDENNGMGGTSPDGDLDVLGGLATGLAELSLRHDMACREYAVTASGWDPRNSAILALGRQSGVVQLFDVEYLVDSTGSTCCSSTTTSTGRAAVDDGAALSCFASAPPIIGEGRRDTAAFSGADVEGAGGGACNLAFPRPSRLSCMAIQQKDMAGPVTALDWIPQSHLTVVAARRRDGFGFHAKLLDLRASHESTTYLGPSPDTFRAPLHARGTRSIFPSVRCFADQVACHPSQRYVATAGSAQGCDIVQLWDVRMAARPVGCQARPYKGYKSLCWSATEPGVLLGAMQDGTLRAHAFHELSLSHGTSGVAVTASRADSRGALGSDTGSRGLGCTRLRHATGNAIRSHSQLTGVEQEAVTDRWGPGSLLNSGYSGTEVETEDNALDDISSVPMASLNVGFDAALASAMEWGDGAYQESASTLSALRCRRLPARVPAAAVQWRGGSVEAHNRASLSRSKAGLSSTTRRGVTLRGAAPREDRIRYHVRPIPSDALALQLHSRHGAAHGDTDNCAAGSAHDDADGDDEFGDDEDVVAPGCRTDLPQLLLLNEKNGELYSQVYNPHGSVTAFLQGDTVLAGVGPNVFVTRVFTACKGRERYQVEHQTQIMAANAGPPLEDALVGRRAPWSAAATFSASALRKGGEPFGGERVANCSVVATDLQLNGEALPMELKSEKERCASERVAAVQASMVASASQPPCPSAQFLLPDLERMDYDTRDRVLLQHGGKPATSTFTVDYGAIDGRHISGGGLLGSVTSAVTPKWSSPEHAQLHGVTLEAGREGSSDEVTGANSRVALTFSSEVVAAPQTLMEPSWLSSLSRKSSSVGFQDEGKSPLATAATTQLLVLPQPRVKTTTGGGNVSGVADELLRSSAAASSDNTSRNAAALASAQRSYFGPRVDRLDYLWRRVRGGFACDPVRNLMVLLQEGLDREAYAMLLYGCCAAALLFPAAAVVKTPLACSPTISNPEKAPTFFSLVLGARHSVPGLLELLRSERQLLHQRDHGEPQASLGDDPSGRTPLEQASLPGASASPNGIGAPASPDRVTRTGSTSAFPADGSFGLQTNRQGRSTRTAITTTTTALTFGKRPFGFPSAAFDMVATSHETRAAAGTKGDARSSSGAGNDGDGGAAAAAATSGSVYPQAARKVRQLILQSMGWIAPPEAFAVDVAAASRQKEASSSGAADGATSLAETLSSSWESSKSAQPGPSPHPAAKFFVQGDGLEQGSLQAAVERRVAILVFLDRFEEAAELLALHSMHNAQYPSIALMLSVANRRRTAPLRFSEVSCSGITYWLHLALTYVDLVMSLGSGGVPSRETSLDMRKTAEGFPDVTAAPPPSRRFQTRFSCAQQREVVVGLFGSYPSLPISDKVGLAAALLLPASYEEAHVSNMMEVLRMLVQMQYDRQSPTLPPTAGPSLTPTGVHMPAPDTAPADLSSLLRGSDHPPPPPSAFMACASQEHPPTSNITSIAGTASPGPFVPTRIFSQGPTCGVSTDDGSEGIALAQWPFSIEGCSLLLVTVVEGVSTDCAPLQRYVDETCDVQTSLSYAAAFGNSLSSTVRTWRDAYRRLLNDQGLSLWRSRHDLQYVKLVKAREEAEEQHVKMSHSTGGTTGSVLISAAGDGRAGASGSGVGPGGSSVNLLAAASPRGAGAGEGIAGRLGGAAAALRGAGATRQKGFPTVFGSVAGSMLPTQAPSITRRIPNLFAQTTATTASEWDRSLREASGAALRGSTAAHEAQYRAVELRCSCGQAMHSTSASKSVTPSVALKPKTGERRVCCGNPECRLQQAPMCTVCGDRMEHRATELPPERFFAWCSACLHGGHWCHLSEWFRKHAKCPVEDCPCRCFDSVSLT